MTSIESYAMKNLHRLAWKRRIQRLFIIAERENICATLPCIGREVNMTFTLLCHPWQPMSPRAAPSGITPLAGLFAAIYQHG